ncbi:MdoG [Oceaniovalibus guishaninsula JLT2003]|uniref:MdoG n=1 Tax=Oceaniovalibus guishaninsula JLT2003 TaxID=1231392 RepID=K2HC37_9RHOB|nr:glucan biosynthesis protein G [Oceaniovalibus guishaninsula]EKE44157.1 MdoG [Oceaniovalibus guishaninsula JLT2003]
MIDRRSFLALAAACMAARPAGAKERPGVPIRFGPPQPFGPDGLEPVAADLASRPWKARPELPREWTDLTYDQHRLYWFREKDALWNGTDLPVRVDLLHPGLYFRRAVRIDVAEGNEAREILFDLDLYDRTDKAPSLPVDDTVGFSGFRLRSELDRPGIYTEFAVFQGASYFRAIARGLTYGLSARGLAIGTGTPEGEEFPDFTRFVLERPQPGATVLVVHALLDSPSVAGAYRFEISPGDVTGMNVRATLFPRKTLKTVGLAPLTSMFLFDETNRNRFDDYRPAVHDSDGLAILNGNGEPLWRPLANPRELQISAFLDRGVGGFGLMQRPRRFGDYADLEAHYQDRPGLWVTPEGDWGKGAVKLVEIPADREWYDNIVAFWQPADPLEPGVPHRHAYRLDWGADPAPQGDRPELIVTQTRIGASPNGGHVVTVDFQGDDLSDADMAGLVTRVTLSGGTLLATKLQRNPETGGPRLAFTFDAADLKSIEMRAEIDRESRRISEVWLYRWTI